MNKQIKNKNTVWLGDRYLSRARYYGLGDFLSKAKTNLTETLNNSFSTNNAMGSIASGLSGLTSIVGSGINNAQTTDTSSIENSIKSFTNNPIESSSREALSNQWVNEINPSADYTGDDFRTSDRERIGNTLNSTISGITTGAKIGGIWGGVIGGIAGLGSGIAGIITGNKKANRQARQLNAMTKQAAMDRHNQYNYMADYLDEQDTLNFLRQSFANGGYLGQTHGSIFSNNVTHVNEGGLHSENPYGGVQSGVDEEGTPNLVEEGEVIFNDYVFSNRLSPTKEQLKEALLPEKYADRTFAWIANELSKESEERANDTISMNGLNDSMNKLIQVHELVRQENKIKKSNKFWSGGDLKKKAAKYAKKHSGAREGSPRYQEVYEQKLAELQQDENERQNAISRNNEINKQVRDYLSDRGYNLKDTAYDENINFNVWSSPMYVRKLELSDEDQGIIDQILSGNNTYINGKLGNPIEQSQEIYNEEQQSFDDEPIKQDDQTDLIQQYLSQLIGNYRFGYGYRGFGYPQQRQQPQDISLTAPDANELERQNRIAAQRELDKIGLYGLDPIKTPTNLTTQAIQLGDPEKERMDKEADDYIVDKMRDVNIPGEKFDPTSLLKYAPILGNAISLIGNRKDYSDVNAFMDKTQNPRSVEFTPIGNYIRPEYISPWEMTNPIERQASATRSAIMDNSGNNRAAANAALVGSDYNTLSLLGQAYLQGKQYNNQQRLQAADFNRGTDQYNSQGALQASTANMSLNDYYLNRALHEYNMRNNIDMNYNNARSANSTALTQNLFNLYRDQYVRNQANSNRLLRYIDTGFGNSARK